MKMFISRAASVLLDGGVIACPTEGVFGLSCMPDDPRALLRLLAIKQRDPAKGLILIAAKKSHLDDWIDLQGATIPDPDPTRPVTWLVNATPQVSGLVLGDHDSLAVRITTNPTARALCEAVASPLVSTSANLAGQPTVRNQFILRRKFSACVDYVVPGHCGPAAGPSEIRNLMTDELIRPRTA